MDFDARPGVGGAGEGPTEEPAVDDLLATPEAFLA